MSGMGGSRETNQVWPAHGQSPFGRYRPGPHLSPFIRNYWTLAPTGKPGVCRRQRVVPDGCIDVILVRHSPTEVLKSLVVGTMTRPIFEDLTTHAEYLGIRFAPGGFRHFFRTPARELTDRIVPWESLLVLPALGEQVTNVPDTQMRLRVVESILTQQLLSDEPEPILAAVLREISVSRGLVSMARLSGLSGWSPRHLRRVFHESVGVGPKTFCRIIRFQHALHILRRRLAPDLLQTALDAGYYDQAHFIHDFHGFYGASPSAVSKDSES